MRAVVDVNVLIPAVLSARGPSAQVLRRSRDGAVEVIVSELPLAELGRALAYPQIRDGIPARRAAAFIGWLSDQATVADDPSEASPVQSSDPADDYLLALAIGQRAFLVTGDQHLLCLSEELPILRPTEFARKLSEDG